MIPSSLAFVVLVFAAYRLTRLAGWDDFPLAARLRERATEGRPTLDHLVGCPFCVGWWISLATYGAWLAFPRATLYAAMPLAISGAVGLIAKNLDP